MLDKEERFIQTMEKVINLSCKRLPDDVYAKLGELREKEDSPLQKSIYDTYFDNLEKAIRYDRPCCQDTAAGSRNKRRCNRNIDYTSY